MRRLGNRPDALIEALHAAQEAFGYIDDDALRYVSETLTVPPSLGPPTRGRRPA